MCWCGCNIIISIFNCYVYVRVFNSVCVCRCVDRYYLSVLAYIGISNIKYLKRLNFQLSIAKVNEWIIKQRVSE